MLIRFNIKNFLSFSSKENGNSEEFSMIASGHRRKQEHTYSDDNIKLLKFAAVYGANASGKSNLIKAISFMKRTVTCALPDGCTSKYCRAEAGNKYKPSYFELEIMLNGSYYSYGFEVILSKKQFISEWLVELFPDNREQVLFSRDIINGEYELGGCLIENPVLRRKLDVYQEDISSDSSILFLTTMNRNKKNLYASFKEASVIKSVYDWLDSSLDIIFPHQSASDYVYSNASNFDEISRLLFAFGTGVKAFIMKDISEEEVLRRVPEGIRNAFIPKIEDAQAELQLDSDKKSIDYVLSCYSGLFVITVHADSIKYRTIKLDHGLLDVLFDFDEESDGTRRILDLVGILIADEEKTYIIDELDRCLHPRLTYKFVEAFLEVAEKKNIQLIVTTHESRLMNLDLLRRDEIWFVDKRSTGESDIYSLEEYSEKFDMNVDTAYLDGRFGGVPVFGTVFPFEEGDEA